MIDRSLYPLDWDDISRRIRFERAGGRCEQCGLKHGQQIIRSRQDGTRYLIWDEETWGYCWPDGTPIRLSEISDEFSIDGRHTTVILTVHHIGVPKPDGSPGSPHDKMDCRDENLAALCQRCHLLADMPTHVANRKRTLARRKHEALRGAGNVPLPGLDAS